MSENYESLTVTELKQLAKDRGIRVASNATKQRIIDALVEGVSDLTELETAARETEEQESDSVSPRENPVPHQFRTASIISDDEEDDIPVLTVNRSPLTRPITSISQPSAAEKPSAAASPLSSISSKAPAFTLEGSRTWHNPRVYQSPGGTSSYTPRTSSWGASPLRAPSAMERSSQDVVRFGQRVYSAAKPELSASKPQMQQAPSGRFGPAEPSDGKSASGSDDHSFLAGGYMSQSISSFTPTQQEINDFAQSSGDTSTAVSELLATGECGDAEGILEIHSDGYGFLRVSNYQPGKNDVYVANAQIRRFGLKNGDFIQGKTRPQHENERYSALLYITEINGMAPEEAGNRVAFENLTAIYPKQRIVLCESMSDPALNAIDLLCPIGFGQRALISAPTRSGKSELIQKLALAIETKYPSAHVMLLLLGSRPEEVTALKESVKGEVIHANFDSQPEATAHIAELALEHAMRLAEAKKDVILLTDSLTNLCLAYNTMAPANSRTLQSGLALGSLVRAKRFFGAARNLREGGSLTIIATMQTGGSSINENIIDEFKGTSNMTAELIRIPGEKRMFPVINPDTSETRRDELMLSKDEKVLENMVRETLMQVPGKSYATLVQMLYGIHSQSDLLKRLSGKM